MAGLGVARFPRARVPIAGARGALVGLVLPGWRRAYFDASPAGAVGSSVALTAPAAGGRGPAGGPISISGPDIDRRVGVLTDFHRLRRRKHRVIPWIPRSRDWLHMEWSTGPRSPRGKRRPCGTAGRPGMPLFPVAPPNPPGRRTSDQGGDRPALLGHAIFSSGDTVSTLASPARNRSMASLVSDPTGEVPIRPPVVSLVEWPKSNDLVGVGL